MKPLTWILFLSLSCACSLGCSSGKKSEAEKPVPQLLLEDSPSNWIRSTILSPDGKLLFISAMDGVGRLWDFQNGKPLLLLEGPKESIFGAVFSPDSKLLLTYGGYDDKTGRLWDVQTGKVIHILEKYKFCGSCAAFSPDGKLMLTSGDLTVSMWNVETGKQIHLLEGKRSRPNKVA